MDKGVAVSPSAAASYSSPKYSSAADVHNYVNVQSSRTLIKICELDVNGTLESCMMLVSGVHMASCSKGILKSE